MNPDNDYVEVFHADDGWHWRRRDANHQIVSISGEGFTTHTYALESATELNPEVAIVDIDKEN